MPQPAEIDTPVTAAPHEENTSCRDRWLWVVTIIMVALYGYLLFLKPAGEGWGRGWNMVGYWLYASPTALIAAGIAAWRSGKLSGICRKVAALVATAGFLFPIIAGIVMRLRA